MRYSNQGRRGTVVAANALRCLMSGKHDVCALSFACTKLTDTFHETNTDWKILGACLSLKTSCKQLLLG